MPFPDDLYVIPVKLPDRVLSLLGYFGVSQLVAIYQINGDYYAFDGVTLSTTLLDKKSLDIFFNHPLNCELFKNIKSSDHSFYHESNEPTDALMLNVINLKLYAGSLAQIKQLTKEHAIHGLHENPLASHLSETQIKKYTQWGVLDEDERSKLAKLYSQPLPDYHQFMAGNHRALTMWLDEVYRLQENGHLS